MKNRSLILAPPLVFALTAMLAWYTGPSTEKKSEESGHAVESYRIQSDGVGTNDSGLQAALLRMESQISAHNPAPPAGKTHNAKEMNRHFGPASHIFCGSGMPRIEYAHDWAEQDPEKMFEWLVRKSQRASTEASILFSTWAKSNTEAALTASLKIPNLELRAQALMSCLQVLCKSNPERAEQLLLQNLSIFSTDDYGPTLDGGEAFTATWNLLLSLPPGKKRTHLQAGLLDGEQGGSVWNTATKNQRREWIEAGFSPYKPDPKTFEGLEDLMRELAESSNDSLLASNFIQNYGDEWVKRDLAACLEWAQTHLKGKQRVRSFSKLESARTSMAQSVSGKHSPTVTSKKVPRKLSAERLPMHENPN